MKEHFSIAAVLPFWRWAVCPENNCSPGVPYYTEKAAREFFEATKQALPWAGVYLIKRHYFRGVEVIDYCLANPSREQWLNSR